MDRRSFIKLGVSSGIIATSGMRGLMADTISPSGIPDMVAVRNGEPAQMLDAALKAFGGMKSFIKPGQRVCVKPNIGWDKSPEMAANTNPELVRRTVEHCFEAGAREVVVFDHTCHRWQACYSNSGIEKAAKDAGAKVVSGDSELYYQEVEIPNGVVLKKDKVHQAILEADVVINMPIIKHHGAARITLSLKNLMGINWDRGHWHHTNLNQCIADFSTRFKPTLNIVDGYRVLMQNGPIGNSLEDVHLVKSLLVGTDMVALDTAATRIFGGNPADISYLSLAQDLGVGTMDLASLNVQRIAL